MPAQNGFWPRKVKNVRANRFFAAQNGKQPAQSEFSPRKVNFSRAERI
jgi:hypothetical protein